METRELNLFLQPVDETSVLPIENKKILNFTKAELSEIASQIVEAVDDGTADPIDTLIIAKKLNYVAESIVEMMRGKVTLPDPKYKKHNVDMREQMTGTRYFFDGCNDPVWNEKNSQASILSEEMTQRQEWLKSLKGPVKEKVDEETGETESFDNPVNPAAKIGSPGIVLTLR